jgi:hypothetical protein
MEGQETKERELSRAEVLSLPWPSAKQQAAFAAHVCWAHSWYKHLPLLTGGDFVIFLAADAGAGYSDAAPRLHYSWNTTDEYRTRFGYLDYMWLGRAKQFCRDGGRPALRLPPDLSDVTRVTLFPFASSDFNAPDACMWGIHDEGFEQLRAGTPHPVGRLVLAWRESRRALGRLWGGLSRGDQELVVRLSNSGPEAPVPPAVTEYVRLARLADSVYTGLQRGEEAKVFRAIGCLAALRFCWEIEESGR